MDERLRRNWWHKIWRQSDWLVPFDTLTPAMSCCERNVPQEDNGEYSSLYGWFDDDDVEVTGRFSANEMANPDLDGRCRVVVIVCWWPPKPTKKPYMSTQDESVDSREYSSQDSVWI